MKNQTYSVNHVRIRQPDIHDLIKHKGLHHLYLEVGVELNNPCKLDEDLITIKNERAKNSYLELFKMIQKFWPIYYKGGGYRSDLEINEKMKKKLNIYGQIGRDLKLSGNKVKHIRKVGIVNPSYFEKIESGQISLYQAYLKCISKS